VRNSKGKAGITKDTVLGRRGSGCQAGCGAPLPLPSKLSFVALELMGPALKEGAFSKTPQKSNPAKPKYPCH
jgi:hypothetical protein